MSSPITRPRGRWRLFGMAVAALVALFAAAMTLGLHAIDAAYHGRGYAFLQPVMDARDVLPIDHYRAKLLAVALAMLGTGVAVCAMVLVTTSDWFFRRFVGEATAGRLGFMRVLICSVLFFDATTIDLGSAAVFPPEARLEMGVLEWLYALPLGLEQLNDSAAALRAWQAVTAALLLCGALGWRTRLVLPLAAAFYLVQGGILRQYDRLFHTGLTPFYVLCVLCFTPCGDAWSLDRLRRVRLGRWVPAADLKLAAYGWARWLCWVPVAITYTEAGLTKVVRVGPHWWAAPNLRAIFLRDSVERAELRLTFIPQLLSVPDAVYAMLGIVTLVAEILFILVLFSVVARRVLPVMMIGMHIGIWAFQGIRFFDLIFVQLIFIDWAPVGAWAAARFPRLRFGLADAAARAARAVSTPRLPSTSPPDDRTTRAAATRFGYPLGACAIAVMMLGVWSQQIEFYPLSSMNLYASFNGTSVVSHLKVVAHLDTGEARRVYLQDMVDILGRTNYRESLHRGFAPETTRAARMARRYLRACVDAHNRVVAAEAGRIARLEVQRWEWDYRAHPDHPEFGDVVGSYVVDVTPSPALPPGEQPVAAK